MLHRRWIEYGAWLAGAALLAVFVGARWWAENERIRGLAVLRATAAYANADSTGLHSVQPGAAGVDAALSTPSVDGGEATVDQSLWSDNRAREYALAVTQPGVPAGALLIPSIRLEVPIYPGASELNLNRGAAHIEGTAPLGTSGNVGIAAHRDGFFRSLESLRMDAEVILEAGGQSVSYRVSEIRIVKPTDVHVLAPTGTPSVTLVTCYPFYYVGNAPERYIVRAELVGFADGLASAGRQVSAP